MLQNFIASILLPPGMFVLLLLISLVLFKRFPRIAISLIALNTVAILTLSMPIVASHLMNLVEPQQALNQSKKPLPAAQAIIILAGGRHTQAPEYNVETVNEATLTRLRYGAKLYRQTKLPILVTGGNSDIPGYAEGDLMAGILRHEFLVPVEWVENQSQNTAENAAMSFHLLSKHNITHIFLVTNAWHMPRAVARFEAAGFTVTPAPTGFNGFKGGFSISDFFPSPGGLEKSHHVFHELLGQLWYRIRYPST